MAAPIWSVLTRLFFPMTHRPNLASKSAAVEISTKDERLAALTVQPSLHALLSNSPLRDLEFGDAGVRAPVRDIGL
jgi:hypothetical protein